MRAVFTRGADEELDSVRFAPSSLPAPKPRREPRVKPHRPPPAAWHLSPRSALRERNMGRYHRERREWAEREAAAWRRPPTPGAVRRVMLVRHGMGLHNDLKGALSAFNRDAVLNEAGREQAIITGHLLRDAGVLGELHMVAVSPFRRALQTAHLLMGAEGGGSTPTLVQPLAAEHSLNWSAIQRGDRGSTPDELRRQFPWFDFAPVEQYCRDRGVTEPGAWWHHGPRSSETNRSFRTRTQELRRWLASAGGGSRVLLVGHGGLFKLAFGYPKFHNCEFRVFDILPDGRYVRVATGEEGGAIVPDRPRTSALAVHSIARSKVQGHRIYHIAGCVDGAPFEGAWRLSQLRDGPARVVREALTDPDFVRRIGSVGYSSSTLQAAIWAFPKSSLGASGKLAAWLDSLGGLLREPFFPDETREYLVGFLTLTDE